jgi:hypothetical protein
VGDLIFLDRDSVTVDRDSRYAAPSPKSEFYAGFCQHSGPAHEAFSNAAQPALPALAEPSSSQFRSLTPGETILDRYAERALSQLPRTGKLLRITIGLPPGTDASLVLADLRGLGAGAFVICRDGSGKEHLHGLLHVGPEECARSVRLALVSEGSVALHGRAIEVKGPIRGWKPHASGKSSEALQRSIWNIAQYDLALAAHAGKLSREQPTGFRAWGCFEGLPSVFPSWVFRRFAPPALAVVTACECGCGQATQPGRRYVDDRHSGRARARRHRAKPK